MSASENTPPRSYDFEFPLPPDAPYETRKDFVKYQLENTLSMPWSAKCIQEIYAEMFQHFSRETFNSLPPSLKGELRNCLESQGINIRGGSSRRVTDELFLAMEYSHTWPDVTTRATSVVEGRKEGRKEGIIGRSITAQVGRGRCDQRSWLRIAIFSRCLRSLPSQLWVVAPSLFIDEWKEPPGCPTELQEYIAYNLYSGLFRCFGHP